MGYTTDILGRLYIKEEVSKRFFEYFNDFCYTRRMKRNNDKIKLIYPTWQLMCFDGKLGCDGEFFCFTPEMGQIHDITVEDYNRPPSTQPSLWCNYILTPLNSNDINKSYFHVFMEWDGSEKFYCYLEWIKYLITNFFEPLNYHLSGAFLTIGESASDAGYIIVDNNYVKEYNYQSSLEELLNLQNNDVVIECIKNYYISPDDIYKSYWDDDEDWEV